MRYYPLIIHTIDQRKNAMPLVQGSAERFEKLNGIRPRVVTRDDFDISTNPYWYVAWAWELVPDDYDYMMCFDSKILPIRTLPELPDLKFAAVADRHDRVNQAREYSAVVKRTGRLYQPLVFFAHRDTRPAFEQLKAQADLPEHNHNASGAPSTLGTYGRAHFIALNELIQDSFSVHELSRAWNFNITYEKQYYFRRPYMLNLNSNEFGTWAYFKYIMALVNQIDELGGSLDGPEEDGWLGSESADCRGQLK